MRLPRQEEPVNFLVMRIGSLCGEEGGGEGRGVRSGEAGKRVSEAA